MSIETTPYTLSLPSFLSPYGRSKDGALLRKGDHLSDNTSLPLLNNGAAAQGFSTSILETSFSLLGTSISVPVNGTLFSDDGIDDCITMYDKQNIRVYKLKISDTPTTAHTIDTVLHKLPEGARLRLDANRGFSFESAQLLLKTLNNYPIDYIEELTKNPEDLLHLKESTQIPFALDETIRSCEDLEAPTLSAVSYLVVKPYCIGDFATLHRLVLAAQDKDLKVVFSTTFESAVGVSTLARIASHYSPNITHGLYPYLPHPITKEYLSVVDGCLIIDD